MANPTSIQEWLDLASQHEATAKILSGQAITAGQAVFHVGLSVECALKAYIWQRERFNIWPTRKARNDLWTHSLRELCQIAQIDVLSLGALSPSWHTLLQWNRHQGYEPKLTPLPVVKGYLEAAFGLDGAVTWIRQSFL